MGNKISNSNAAISNFTKKSWTFSLDEAHSISLYYIRNKGIVYLIYSEGSEICLSKFLCVTIIQNNLAAKNYFNIIFNNSIMQSSVI